MQIKNLARTKQLDDSGQILQADDDRVRFAVQLIDIDANVLDLTRLRSTWRELGVFLGQETPTDSIGIEFVRVGKAGQVLSRGEWPPSAEDYVRRVIAACAASAQALLGAHLEGDPVVATVDGQVTVQATAEGLTFRTPGRSEAFQLGLVSLLAGPAGARLRRCPECGVVFVRVRRQLYCSDACTDRATWRKYPDAKKKRARKKQYEKHGWKLGARSRKARKGSERP